MLWIIGSTKVILPYSLYIDCIMLHHPGGHVHVFCSIQEWEDSKPTWPLGLTFWLLIKSNAGPRKWVIGFSANCGSTKTEDWISSTCVETEVVVFACIYNPGPGGVETGHPQSSLAGKPSSMEDLVSKGKV